MRLSDLQVYTEPFKLLVFDNVFPEGLVRAAFQSWPDKYWDNWHKYSDAYSIKYATKDGRNCPPPVLALLDKMSEFPLELYLGPLGLTKCEFFPDMHYHAGGMHCLLQGGKLDCHIDALQHPIKDWLRVANLILYVTPDWKPEYGGQLNMHTSDETRTIVRALEPKFNRLVVFAPSKHAYHSVSSLSENSQPRCSLATFFWCKGIKTNLNEKAQFE